MMKSISATIDDLRSKLGAAEHRQVELNSEILEISYVAHTGDGRAKKRLDEITIELGHLTTEVSSLTAALAEAARRELQQRDQEMAAKRRDDASKADAALAEAAVLAEKFDAALVTLRDTAVAFELKMGEARRLAGNSGVPAYDVIRIFMFRTLRTALHRTPLHVDAIAPLEQTTLRAAFTAWSRSAAAWLKRIADPVREAA